MTEITSWYIDDDGTLHTWIGNKKHVTFEDVESDEQAEKLMREEEEQLNKK